MRLKANEETSDNLEGEEDAADYVNFSIIPAVIMRSPVLSHGEKLLYSVIHTFNSNAKPFFGSNKFLADSIGTSERSVRRILTNLEKLGLITREYIDGEPREGRKTIEILPLPQAKNNLGVGQSHPRGRTKMTQGGDKNDLGVGQKRPHTNKVTNKVTNKDKNTIISEKFEEFWEFYPRKVSKKKARDVFMKIKKDHDEVIEGLKKHLPLWAKTEKRFIPHPTTWLNQERWEDEIEKPESNLTLLKKKYGN